MSRLGNREGCYYAKSVVVLFSENGVIHLRATRNDSKGKRRLVWLKLEAGLCFTCYFYLYLNFVLFQMYSFKFQTF